MIVIRRKHFIVSFVSSAIITGVLLLTLIGFRLYIQWKKESFELKYSNSIYRLSAELFRKNIVLSNFKVTVGNEGSLKGVAILEGSISNNTKKIVSSVLIEVSFLGHDGIVVFHDWIYPLGGKFDEGPGGFTKTAGTRNILLPGEGISFRRALRSCPEDVAERIGAMQDLAKGDPKNRIQLVYSITGLSVI